jgi:hypothetical protein
VDILPTKNQAFDGCGEGAVKQSINKRKFSRLYALQKNLTDHNTSKIFTQLQYSLMDVVVVVLVVVVVVDVVVLAKEIRIYIHVKSM